MGLERIHTEERVCVVPLLPGGPVAGFQSPLYNGFINAFVTDTTVGCVELKHLPMKPRKFNGGHTYIRVGSGTRLYPDSYGQTLGTGLFLRWGGTMELIVADPEAAGWNVGTWGMNFGFIPPATGTEIFIGYEYSPEGWKREDDEVDHQLDHEHHRSRAIEDYSSVLGIPIEGMTNAPVAWAGETAASSTRWAYERDEIDFQLDHLTWRAIEGYGAAFAVPIEDMLNSPVAWTAEA